MSNSISSPSGWRTCEQELLLGGEELPVEEILQLPAVDGNELGTGGEPKLRAQ